MSREKFLALEGSVLFCEVDIVKDGDNVRVIPKPFSDPLMVRSKPTDGVYYEGSITTHSLSNMFIYLNEEEFHVNREFQNKVTKLTDHIVLYFTELKGEGEFPDYFDKLTRDSISLILHYN